MSYIKVIDHPNLVRDSNSKAILNTDVDALNKYKEERNFKLKLANVVNDVDGMKEDISEIKTLLHKLLEKK